MHKVPQHGYKARLGGYEYITKHTKNLFLQTALLPSNLLRTFFQMMFFQNFEGTLFERKNVGLMNKK
jgi:hypothetical protein